MIGKKEWFKRRKYLGWGLQPATWQGWAYTGAMIAPLIVMQYFPMNEASLAMIVVWLVLAAIDLVSIMISLPADERERAHEASAERNALWVMLAILATGSGFAIARDIVLGVRPQDNIALMTILAAVICGLIAKASTNYWLDRHN
jgi:hypothetical protein